MAEYSATATLTTPGGTIVFNPVGLAPPCFMHDPDVCSGLDGAPLRSTTEDAPVTDGGIWHPTYKSSREITLGGILLIASVDDIATLEAELMAALDSIGSNDPTATGSYTWTPTGATLHTIAAVRCDVAVVFSGPAYQKKYTFGLEAIDPTITVA